MDRYNPQECYDLWKNDRLVGRLMAGSFYSTKGHRGFNFNRVDGGIEGDLFVYRGRPCARLVGMEIIGDDGTVLRLKLLPTPIPKRYA